MQVDTQRLEARIRGICGSSEALLPQGESCISAIRASAPRSLLGERHLARAARYSVASSVMTFVAAAFEAGRVDERSAFATLVLFDEAAAIAPEADPSRIHRRTPRPEIPAEWTGRDLGPWSKTADGGRVLTLAHDPRMPGGDWVVCIGGLPCLRGADPARVAEGAERLAGLWNAAAKRPFRGPPGGF